METNSLSDLQSLTQSLTIEENRLKLDKSKILSIIKLLNDKCQSDIQLECLRALRNGVANMPTNAQIVVEIVFADGFQKIVERFLNSEGKIWKLRLNKSRNILDDTYAIIISAILFCLLQDSFCLPVKLEHWNLSNLLRGGVWGDMIIDDGLLILL